VQVSACFMKSDCTRGPLTATSLAIVARTAGDPMATVTAFREIICAINGDVPVRASTMNDALSISMATPVQNAADWRVRGIGVRMAMGAASGDILRLVMGQGLRLAVAGVALGCALAYGLALLLRGMLFAVAPADPVVFLAVPLALVATAAAATAIPALRASRVDPMAALRAD